MYLTFGVSVSQHNAQERQQIIEVSEVSGVVVMSGKDACAFIWSLAIAPS